VVFESRINLKRRITLGAMTAPIVKKEVPTQRSGCKNSAKE
jgi:hypothetical protein